MLLHEDNGLPNGIGSEQRTLKSFEAGEFTQSSRCVPDLGWERIYIMLNPHLLQVVILSLMLLLPTPDTI